MRVYISRRAVLKKLWKWMTHVLGAEFKLDVEASDGERTVALADLLACANASAASFASHVPGMSATGKSQVAVKTIP